MRTLLVTDEFGAPEISGYRQRIANTVRALAALGPVEWVVLVPPGRTDHRTGASGAPADVAVSLHAIEVPRRHRHQAVLRWLVRREPWRVNAVARGRLHAEVRRILAGAGPFDLVYFTQLDTWFAVREVVSERLAVPHVAAVDFNDIESLKVVGRRRARSATRRTWRDHVFLLGLALDSRFWQRAEARAAATMPSFVCSELDRTRLGGRPHVLPNVLPPRSRPAARRPDPERPTLLFVGSLSYRPNIDAAERAATEILPRVQRAVPGARLRIVGSGDVSNVAHLRDRPGVDVIGMVDDLADELDTASLSIVPLRYGGGTRIKIIEALAHAVPVVSTSVGAEGIGLVDGVHLRIADDDEGLADACVELLRDPEHAATMAHAGAEFVTRFEPARVQADLQTLLRELYERAARSASTSA